ncbi:MAG: DUF3021 domain-containing protein [Clostridiaceae bacterium]|nr:DUF3021 domain-containing protein [Clostridiaceae bacterium]
MKKQIIIRGLLGFPLGIAFGYIITIIIGFAMGESDFSPCVPALVKTIGSEIGAVALQAFLSGILGSLFAASSLIWEIENWSIAKQTGVYFTITALGMLPIAYFANWMEHSFGGFLFYFGIFIGVFIIIWITQYMFWKVKIRRMNEKVDRH